MNLMFITSFLCFFISLLHFILKPVIAILLAPTKEERQLQDEIVRDKEDLANISVRDEYTVYVKMERKILASQTKLNQLKSARQSQDLIVRYAVPYGSQAIITLLLVAISIYHRYTPVIQFTEQFDLVPFAGLLRFPTGIQGGISLPFWIFINNFVSRHVASYL